MLPSLLETKNKLCLIMEQHPTGRQMCLSLYCLLVMGYAWEPDPCPSFGRDGAPAPGSCSRFNCDGAPELCSPPFKHEEGSGLGWPFNQGALAMFCGRYPLVKCMYHHSYLWFGLLIRLLEIDCCQERRCRRCRWCWIHTSSAEGNVVCCNSCYRPG